MSDPGGAAGPPAPPEFGAHPPPDPGGATVDPFGAGSLEDSKHSGAIASPSAPEPPPPPEVHRPMVLPGTTKEPVGEGGRTWAVAAVATTVVAVLGALSVVMISGSGQEGQVPFESPGQDSSAGTGLVAPTRSPPDDVTDSEERIRAAYATVFDPAADPGARRASVAGPLTSLDRLEVLLASCGPATPEIEAVTFTSPTDAAVDFRLTGSSVPGGDSYRLAGGASLVADDWKVTAATLESVLAVAAPVCG